MIMMRRRHFEMYANLCDEKDDSGATVFLFPFKIENTHENFDGMKK